MPKDSLLHARLQREGLGRTFTPTHPDAATLCLAHDPRYVQAFLDGSIDAAAMRRIGLPWSPALVQRTLVGVGSAILAARLALQLGLAVMCNGGTHHAHYGHGSGWCIFNDQAVAARSVQRDMGVERILFVDLDVHQGDGTAAIFAGDDSVFTFSMHCEAQPFPHELQRSDLDVALPEGCQDAQYLQALQDALPPLLQRLRPQLVLYNAGVDVHRDDALGKMGLTDAGILARDRFVLATCAAAGVPVAAAIGGGYNLQDHERIVDRHLLLHRAAAEHWPLLARYGMQARRSAPAA
ncbi:hypothetical protein COHA_004837 [Chlorella ohadii]|uniref:Histone deacetylase domain-containing protein n=1 Tax=Chlorella ohadii TaxID=2649997 RepID=A0AAD5DNV0_9CHLO|nr:hypothetical protein COHA_004837 [Chlorella ohadii]